LFEIDERMHMGISMIECIPIARAMRFDIFEEILWVYIFHICHGIQSA
jgi:hypothetical protein